MYSMNSPSVMFGGIPQHLGGRELMYREEERIEEMQRAL